MILISFHAYRDREQWKISCWLDQCSYHDSVSLMIRAKRWNLPAGAEGGAKFIGEHEQIPTSWHAQFDGFLVRAKSPRAIVHTYILYRTSPKPPEFYSRWQENANCGFQLHLSSPFCICSGIIWKLWGNELNFYKVEDCLNDTAQTDKVINLLMIVNFVILSSR